MVLIAISGYVMSEPFFWNSGYAIDKFVYRDECLEYYLLPIIEKYHKEGKLVFWSVLACTHYSFLVQDWFNS